jgi:hypothetical protein
MSGISSKKALEFVRTAELPPAPKKAKGKGLGTTAGEVAEFDFDKAKNQALVVGSDIVSFVKGVTEERREDIVNSALLAQLYANTKVKDKTHMFEWYDAYFDALTNIGWTIHEKQFVNHVESGQNFEVHNAIIKMATLLLGPGAAALTVVKATLDALDSMDDNSPWITVFSRESQSAKTSRFQITLAEEAPDGSFLVTLMAFGVAAKKTVTQVLFFKLRESDVHLKHSSGKVTINTVVLDAIRDAVKQKIGGHSKAFVLGLPDFD